VPEYTTLSSHDDQRDAIVAALDDLAPAATLRVHDQNCGGPERCTCTPQTWTNPLD
jgi:hypothetical protein